MALRNLGQPFGRPGGIINIPAPAGSQLAGQIQMQSMAGLGQALGAYLGQKRQEQLRGLDIQGIQAMGPQQDIFNTMYGARGLQPPQAQMPQMRSRMGQQLQLGNLFTPPLETEYKRAQIESAKALTKQRQEAAKQELPNRMLRQADRYLRVVDDIMSEYWYTPEGPYKDKLLKDAQSAREKAVKLIEKFGASSEAGKASLEQLGNIDEEIKKAGGKTKPVKVQASFMRPTKEQFDRTLRSLTSEEDKDRYYKRYYRPEFSR